MLTCEESWSISWDPENYGWLVITLMAGDVTWHHLIWTQRLRDNWITHCARYWLTITMEHERALLHMVMWCTDIVFSFHICTVLLWCCLVESSLNLERWMIRFIIKDGNSNLNILVRIGLADITWQTLALITVSPFWPHDGSGCSQWSQFLTQPSTFIYNLHSFSSHLEP